MIGVVSVPVQSFVWSVKRIGDRTVPCGEPVIECKKNRR